MTTTPRPRRRTRSEVLAAQSSPYGCCNDNADNSHCLCLEEALPDDTPARPEPPPRPDLGAIKERLEAVAKAYRPAAPYGTVGELISHSLILIDYARELEGLLTDKALDDNARLATLAAERATEVERRRCASIADADADERMARWGGVPPALARYQIAVARRIAAAIREDLPTGGRGRRIPPRC